ncbi:hypothetical protein [Luteibacter sp. 9133]|uniref:hypothetical protein n=1 Tax=Luteibacter sp. 9133 TaxID=1500891 RepID=UPI0005BAF426|nr:hypothetical protein [Luteibacter sp. 9133]
MARVGSRDDETKIAIADLLAVPAVGHPKRAADVAAVNAAMSAVPTGTSQREILSHASIDRLFATVPDDAYVSVYLVAAYLDRSVHSFQRHLRLTYNRGKKTWQGELRKGHPANLDLHGRFRWSYVRQCRSDLEVRQKPVRTVRGQPTYAAFLQALTRAHRFVKDDEGNVLCAWGQGGVTAAQLMEAFAKNGKLALMTPAEALALPWTLPEMRQPWQDAVDDGMAAVTAAVAHGAAKTLARKLAEATGSVTRPPTKRHP